VKILVCDGCGTHAFQEGQQLPKGWSEWTTLGRGSGRDGHFHACSAPCWTAVSSGGRGALANTVRQLLSTGAITEALGPFRPALVEWVHALHEYASASRARAAYAADTGNVRRMGWEHWQELQEREAAALARATAARERAEALVTAAEDSDASRA
jgi:hypothetical protein